MMDFDGAKGKGEAHLYVPADVTVSVSRGERQRNPGGLHESVNLLMTSKPESALTVAIATMQLNNCRSIVVKCKISSGSYHAQCDCEPFTAVLRLRNVC